VAGVLGPPDLVRLGVPVRVSDDGRVVELPDRVAPERPDVEVEPPVHMMVMAVARAGVGGPGKTEPGPDRAIRVQSPFSDIAVPACSHLADQHDLLALYVDGDSPEVPDVTARVEDGLRRPAANPVSGGGVVPELRVEARLLVLPV